MRKKGILSGALTFAVAAAGVCGARAQAPGNWPAAGNDIGHSNWQKLETKISAETAKTDFKFLWKIKLGTATKDAQNFTEPLLALRLINAQGFKDLALWADTDTVYAVDSELGTVVWKKKIGAASTACGSRNLSLVMEPVAAINFGARRAPGAPAPPPPPPAVVPTERRLGVASGGGGFALKGVYAVAGDGMLHELVLTTGVDYAPSAPAVKFLSGAANDGLNMAGKTIYTTTSSECGGAAKGVWAMDVSKPDYAVASNVMKASPLAVTGPTVGTGAVYVVTGKASGEEHANSVLALSDTDLKVNDWYTPASGTMQKVTPTAFTIKGKKMLVAPGGDGKYVLLDASSLGGADHHTPLAETGRISGNGIAPGGLANWQDSTGAVWVAASVTGAVEAKLTTANGAATHGGIVAFKVDDASGKMGLIPAWVSRDMVNPATPVIANGTVIALSQGDASTHAKLYVLDAATGKELYNSGDAISTYAHLTGVSVGDGHAFFTTHDGTMYSFGIGIEH
jgi:outer membrane protein assembly factor BamB